MKEITATNAAPVTQKVSRSVWSILAQLSAIGVVHQGVSTWNSTEPATRTKMIKAMIMPDVPRRRACAANVKRPRPPLFPLAALRFLKIPANPEYSAIARNRSAARRNEKPSRIVGVRDVTRTRANWSRA